MFPALDRLKAPLHAGDLIPPPRFAAKRFEGYRVDPAIPGQKEAVLEVRRFAALRRTLLTRLFGRSGKAGLYLDGGFGVGKTHLLAACFHAAHGCRRYLSFSEAMSLMTVLGIKPAIELLRADLVCIDEFELDDPANTRLADLLVRSLVEKGCRIITTSNTVPGELGQGRMAVDLFRSQLARIEAVFADVHVPGSDFRRTFAQGGTPAGWGPAPAPLPGAPVISARSLDLHLRDLPVALLRRLAAALPAGLVIEGLEPFTDQLAALRLVHFIDRCYDAEVPLRVISTAAIDGLFPAEHCQGAFIKKYRRCQSRFIELCSV